VASIERLRTVDAFVAFDLDGAPFSAGGTRLAPDASEHEAALLARAMTYKFGVLHADVGGAKGAVRATTETRADALARYCEEIRPWVEAGRFATGPDLGTSEADFAPLRAAAGEPSVMTATVDGVPFEDLLTGAGVIAGAEAALGGLDGRTVAIEGFGKVGGGVARAAVAKGARVVAVSTIVGCVHDPDGLDVDALWDARASHGDDCVAHVGRPVLPAAALFAVETDVLVPGARTGVLDASTASDVRASVVAPAANVPYTADGLRVLRERGVIAHADFVCNAGAVIGYRSPSGSTPADVLAAVGAWVADTVREASEHPDGPFAGACARAEVFLRTWRDEDGMPPGPPLA
jgi:glutamate dehydrogenase/leucine dehydrogenase